MVDPNPLFLRRHLLRAPVADLSRRQVLALLPGLWAGGVAAQAGGGDWVAAWGAAVQDYTRMPPAPSARAEKLSLSGTLRQRIRPGLGGERLRVCFSNLFGKLPLEIGAATVAQAGEADGIVPASLRALSFEGRREASVPPGAQLWTDAAELSVQADQPLAVSYALGRETPVSTVHRLPLGATWMAPGRWTDAPRLDGATRSPSSYFITALDVQPQTAARLLVAFGDSLTEGSGLDDGPGSARYPERLAARLRAAGMPVGVVNAGIGGNRLLAEHTGPSALERFERDVLGRSGVSHVLMLLGVNDIGFGTPPGSAVPPLPSPGAEHLATGLQSLVARAQARGVKALLGTLMPFRGSGYWSERNEAKRRTLNEWIRGQRLADGVVDFDAALRDAADPLRLRPEYDSGDHLHPAMPGLAAMAQAVDLGLVK